MNNIQVLNNIKKKAMSFVIMMTVLLSYLLPVHAEELKINGIKLKYLETEYDIYDNVAEIANDIDTNAEVIFDVSGANISKITLYSFSKDGTEKEVNNSNNTTVSFNPFYLTVPAGLYAVIYGSGNTVLETVKLGISVKESVTRAKFENTDVSIGPETGIKIDMDSVLPGMHLDLNMFPIPLTYKRLPDGRSVLGIGWNSTNQNFWNSVNSGKFPTLSHGELIKQFESQYGKTEISKLGLCWSVGGYAVSYDDNPDKMSGQLQFYVGTGLEAAGQYAIFTYSITVTIGAAGEFLFTIAPEETPKFQAELNASFLTSLELYGGVGIGCLASIGVYGKGVFGADMNVLPRFQVNEVYIEGEAGLKAKLFGRTIFTFAIIGGRYDFYKREVLEDGTIVYSGDMEFKATLSDSLEATVANGYAYQAYSINEVTGVTEWNYGESIMTPTEAELFTNESEGNLSFTHKLANNVHPDSGIQISNLHDDNTALIVMISDNESRSSGNRGELSYMLFDNSDKTVSYAAPIATDIDGDGIEDTGGDYNPIVKHGTQSGSNYVVWKRSKEGILASSVLTDVASNTMLCIARYDENSNMWTDAEVVFDNNNIILGDAVVGLNLTGDSVKVFSYTNPENDPAGLSAKSSHDILMFTKSEETGEWQIQTLDTIVGRIKSFDAGEYMFSTINGYLQQVACAYSVETENSKFVNVMGSEISLLNKVYFENSSYAKFVNIADYSALTMLTDGTLYFANGYRNNYKNKIFPLDPNEKLPDAPYQFTGDINGKSLITYLSSENTSQNVVAYIKNAAEDSTYHRVDATDVASSTNVNYFSSSFVGPSKEPLLVYTAQEYDTATFEDGIANLYIQAGEINTHASIEAVEINDFENIDIEEGVATFALAIRNNGLDTLSDVDVYYFDTLYGHDDYKYAGNFDLGQLKPGGIEVVKFVLNDSYTSTRVIKFAITAHSNQYRKNGFQSIYNYELPPGELRIVDAKYNYRDVDPDNYSVTVKAVGVGRQYGTVVFYNRETLEWYQKTYIKDLKPGQTEVVITANEDLHSSDNLETEVNSATLNKNLDGCGWENLAVRVLNYGEELDESRPSHTYRQTAVLPDWILKYKIPTKISKDGTDNKDNKNNENKNTTSTPTPTTTPIPTPTATPTTTPMSTTNSTTTVSSNKKVSVETGSDYTGVILIGIMLISSIGLIAIKKQKV